MTTVRERMETIFAQHASSCLWSPEGNQRYETHQCQKLLDALVAAAQPVVTREQIENVLNLHCLHVVNERVVFDCQQLTKLIDDFLALLTGQPARVWCQPNCPRPWRYGEGKFWGRKTPMGTDGMYIVADSVRFCDACGAARPTED